MIRFISLKPGLILFFIVQSWAISAIFAQSNSVSQGNIIKSVTVIQDGRDVILNIQGILDPSQMSEVVPKQKGKSKTFSISLPNTLVDPETLPSPFIRFGKDSILESAQIKENILEKGDDVVFVVELTFQGKKNLIPELIRPIQKDNLRIRIIDFDLRQKQSQLKKEAEERERQEKIKQNAVSATQRETMGGGTKDLGSMVKGTGTAMKTVREIKKTYHKPALMQVSILNASGISKRAYKLSVFLGDKQKKYIERTLGIKLDIINISNAMHTNVPQTTVYFRENFLKSALLLAQLMPGEQRIVPMRHQKERVGVDIEIYIGKDYK